MILFLKKKKKRKKKAIGQLSLGNNLKANAKSGRSHSNIEALISAQMKRDTTEVIFRSNLKDGKESAKVNGRKHQLADSA